MTHVIDFHLIQVALFRSHLYILYVYTQSQLPYNQSSAPQVSPLCHLCLTSSHLCPLNMNDPCLGPLIGGPHVACPFYEMPMSHVSVAYFP